MTSVRDINLALSENSPLWNIKEIGDKITYTTVNDNVNISYSATVITNKRWPGFNCVFKNGEFFNFYIGNSVRMDGRLFYPQEVLEIQKDAKGKEEYKEPNPDEDPEICESDSDAVVEEKENEDN